MNRSKTCKAIRVIREEMAPPSSGRKLAAALKAKGCKVSQPTLNQLANKIHDPAPNTKRKLNKALGLTDADWVA